MAKTEVRTCFNCSEHMPPETEHFIIDGDPYCKDCVEVREYTACQYYLDGEFMGDSETDSRVEHVEEYDDEYEEEKLYKCIKEFAVDMYDDEEFLIENEQKVIPIGTTWERQDYSSLSDVRLQSELGWLEVDDKTLETHFIEI